MTSLAIGRRAIRRFEHEIETLCDHVSEESRVKRRAKIVCVGHKRKLDAALNEPIEQPRALDSCIKIAVARRAPAEFRLFVVFCGRQPILEDFGHLVLEKSERQAGNRQFRVFGKGPVRVLLSAIAVHQDQRDVCANLVSQGENLPGHEIEKAQVVPRSEQGLRSVKAHRSAEAAVELDHCCVGHG